MGEARRRKLAGTDWTPEARADFIAMLYEGLAQEPNDSTISGITFFPAGQGEPVYISAGDAKRRMGRKPDA
jgi:hypothetical protein